MCWHGYLSVAWCRLAYCPAYATATHCLWYRLTRVVPDRGPLNRCVCVCVLSIVHMTLPTFAAERRAAAPLLLSTPAAVQLVCSASSCRSICPARRALGHHCCCISMGWTDERTLDRYIDPGLHTMQAVSKTCSCTGLSGLVVSTSDCDVVSVDPELNQG